MASHLRKRSIGNSPGTSFRIPDSEIFLRLAVEKGFTARLSRDSREMSKHDLITENCSPKNNMKPNSVNDTAQRLKRLLHWPKMKKRKPESPKKTANDNSVTNSEEFPISLRKRYSKTSLSLPNNKRTLSVRSNAPSPTAKKKFASGLIHGVMQAIPHLSGTRRSSRSSSFSKSPISSYSLSDKQKGIYIGNRIEEASCSNETIDDGMLHKPAFVHKRPLINQICFA